jgi:hypothetical protein
MQAVPTRRVIDVVGATGGCVLETDTQRHPDFGFEDTTYYVARVADADPTSGGSE